jgi:SAM-dependent methyltransferase
MNELDRIRAEYARRQRDPRLRGRYTFFNCGHLFLIQERERALLALLGRMGFEELHELDLLDVGCGAGGWLGDLLRYGASAPRLHGCDLLPNQLSHARRRLPPAVTLACADGGNLPYPSERFDLVSQFTVFTSILDDGLRQRVAAEMWRVLRVGGGVLWYDFRFQRRNPAVRAIHPREVRALFPQGTFTQRRVTLAPPITRRLASRSWFGCEVLAHVSWLCTHDLILIRKMGASDG